MSEEIELHAKSSRDLLVMTVMQGNECVRHLEKINGTLNGHEKRITKLESRKFNNGEQSSNDKKKQAAFMGGLFALGSLIGGSIYAFGQAIGWW